MQDLNFKVVGGIIGLLALGIVMTIGLTSAREKADSEEEIEPMNVSLIASEHRAELPSFTGKVGVKKEQFASEDIDLPAMIHVYASWCSVCEGEAPNIAATMGSRPQMNYYFLAVQDKPKDSLGFAEDNGWTDHVEKPIIFDDPKRTIETDTLGLPGGQPHTLLVNADGEIAWVRSGPSQPGELTGAIDAVLAESA